jgi:8-oxo-dGTP pyrophosphatase MutT (NUDIX family)
MDDEVIPAATLMVWRDPAPGSGEDPRILVVERSARMAFAAGALVFPGGRIDPADGALADRLGVPGEAGRVTAIRETLEESAVPAGISGLERQSLALELQQGLTSGGDFGETLDRHGLSLDLDGLVPFARWMPGFRHARIFDTIFYLVRAPAGEWRPYPQPGECVAAEWASPAELLQRIGRGEASAIFPTKRNLERLAGFRSFDEAVADAQAHPVERIVPWIEDIDGRPHVRIGEGLGYPVTSEPLTSAVRA